MPCHEPPGLVVLGDFNHMHDVQLKRYPLKQTVKSPTHAKSILDCVYTNISKYYLVPTIHPGLGLCHHSIVCCTPNNAIVPNKKSVIINRRINTHSAKMRFVDELNTVSWAELYKMPKCEMQWTYFYDTITTLLNKHLPFKSVTSYDTDKPWVTVDFKSLIRKRQAARGAGSGAKFNMYRNQVNRACKTLRSKYYNRNINGLQRSNPRQWWRKTQALIGRKSENSSLVSLSKDLCNGDSAELAERVNIFFQSVSSHLPPLPPPPDQLYTDVPSKYIISVEDIDRVLLKTDTSKAMGPDDIPSWILHDLAAIISAPICSIFNSSIREGQLPSAWKRADVVPLPKTTPPKCIQSDLRPISLTSILSKQLESFIGNWILQNIGNKLDVYQYGGLRGLSTTHALVDMLYHWHNMVHQHETVRILFIDYSKAFDNVNHNILLEKFEKLDIHPVLLHWLHGFLYHREQRVKINNEVSSWLTLNGAVPQGSWLAPLCFIVYISDITLDDTCIKMHKYIDDITLTENIKTGAQSKLQQQLDTLSKWSSDNNMKVNSKKTKELVISFKKTKPDLPMLMCKDNEIERVQTFKILGVHLSDDLTWREHVEHIHARASPRLYYLRQLKRSGVSNKDLTMYYKSVIRPLLEYACPAWHTSLTNHDSELLEHIQKRALYVIAPGKTYDEALSTTELQSLSNRRESICKTFFEHIRHENNKLNYLLTKRKDIHYNLRHKQPYDIITPHTERFKCSFIMHGLLYYTS